MATLMRDYHMSQPDAMKHPLRQALALVAFTRLYHSGGPMEIEGLGYVAQETERRKANHT